MNNKSLYNIAANFIIFLLGLLCWNVFGILFGAIVLIVGYAVSTYIYYNIFIKKSGESLN